MQSIFRSQSPADGQAQFNLRIDSATATSYSIRAQSLGSAVPANCALGSDELGNSSKTADCS